VPVDTFRSDLELALSRHGPALRRADRHFGSISLERRVLLVAEELAETGQELSEPLVDLRRRHLRHRGGAIGGEKDATAEAATVWRWEAARHAEKAERDDQHQQASEDIAKTLSSVVQAGHDRSHRNVEHLSDLAVRETFEIAQHDNRAMMLRQSLQ